MAEITLEKDKQIYSVGQPLTALDLIVSGRVRVEYPGGAYYLDKGDVIGISEICYETHLLSYTAFEDSTIFTYPIGNMKVIEDFLQKHSDAARLFLLSLFRQINILLEKIAPAEANCAVLRQSVMEDYSAYRTYCSRYRIQPGVLEGLETMEAYVSDESADMWLESYYMGLQRIYSFESAKTLLTDPGISLGMIRKGSLDFHKTYNVLDEHFQYCQQIAQYYFNASGNCLFDFYSSLYKQLGPGSEDSGDLYAAMDKMVRQYDSNPELYDQQAAWRVENFRQSLVPPGTPVKKSFEEVTNAAVSMELNNSLDTILQFAELGQEKSDLFRELIREYKSAEDKNSMDIQCARLRKQLTEEFCLLYSASFKHSLTVSAIPVPVKMFLYFGYVDEELAGKENSVRLYYLARDIKDTGKFHVYTFYHWLMAIYNGKKTPSRNEFDEDYIDYLHKQKARGKITKSQMAVMESDPMGRVEFELNNVFPQANKITFGRITTFCPVFTAENVLKDLDSTYVSVTQINKALEMVRSIDYSAYYRESMDYEHIDIMGKELIHLEYLPDVILMPNVGIRGSMWQEIEGKKRNSSSRMFLSIFHMEDVSTSMIRLTGEFRWEMCKRIQGSRWNDLTERSLTSEYTDYIQFYRKNHELSREAKEKLRTGLQRAKNSFKEMFVRDYIVWILFESNNSPRLNKVARQILFTYCPFSAELDRKLEQNPAYAELLERQRILAGQRLHRLDMLTKKLSNSNIVVPGTLIAEKKFFERKV